MLARPGCSVGPIYFGAPVVVICVLVLVGFPCMLCASFGRVAPFVPWPLDLYLSRPMPLRRRIGRICTACCARGVDEHTLDHIYAWLSLRLCFCPLLWAHSWSPKTPPLRRLLPNVARGRGMEYPSLRPTLKRSSHIHWARVRLVFCTFSLGSLVPSALRSCTRATVHCFPPFPPFVVHFMLCVGPSVSAKLLRGYVINGAVLIPLLGPGH